MNDMEFLPSLHNSKIIIIQCNLLKTRLNGTPYQYQTGGKYFMCSQDEVLQFALKLILDCRQLALAYPNRGRYRSLEDADSRSTSCSGSCTAPAHSGVRQI